MRIGDTKEATCTVCGQPVIWKLRQRLIGPEGMQDVDAIWTADDHMPTTEAPNLEIETDLCLAQHEPANNVEGAFTPEQRAIVLSGRGYDPSVDPIYVPSDQVSWADPHISCVMPTTLKRVKFLNRALRCWTNQTYQDRDLVIVSDGPGKAEIARAIHAALPHDAKVRHVHLPDDPTRLLGQKYNACVELAEGPFIACWADDDWHHPRRLEVVLRAMQAERVPTGATNTMLCYRERDKQAFLYWAPGIRPTLISGTMLFTKRDWEACGKFPKRQRASDSGFVQALLTDLGIPWAAVDDPRLYCAFLHGDNTGNPLGEKTERSADSMISFTPLEGEEANMARHLGADAAAFGF